MRNLVYLTLAGSLAAQWIVVRALHLGEHDPLVSTFGGGIAIFGAAFLLSWAAEAAQKDIPRALAIAFLALIAVLPEYAVDMYFAWQAAEKPEYAAYAAANMTGGNRLLIGLGWSTVVTVYWFRSKKASIELEPAQSLEVLVLLLATVYSFVLPWKATISLWDGAILVSLFVVYMVLASRKAHEEPELEGPAAAIGDLPNAARRFAVISLFVLSGATIILAAEPFAEGLVATGRTFGIDEFVLVQWLAPLASESPEFIVCILYAWHLKPQAGMGALLSSKVNQWTLLVGMLPIVYSIAAGRAQSLPLDARQVEELFLTSAQSVFATAVIADLSFNVREGLLLLSLFLLGLVFTQPEVRYFESFAYLVLTVIVLGSNRQKWKAMRDLPAQALRGA